MGGKGKFKSFQNRCEKFVASLNSVLHLIAIIKKGIFDISVFPQVKIYFLLKRN